LPEINALSKRKQGNNRLTINALSKRTQGKQPPCKQNASSASKATNSLATTRKMRQYKQGNSHLANKALKQVQAR
jgi:hypothetical protein